MPRATLYTTPQEMIELTIGVDRNNEEHAIKVLGERVIGIRAFFTNNFIAPIDTCTARPTRLPEGAALRTSRVLADLATSSVCSESFAMYASGEEVGPDGRPLHPNNFVGAYQLRRIDPEEQWLQSGSAYFIGESFPVKEGVQFCATLGMISCGEAASEPSGLAVDTNDQLVLVSPSGVLDEAREINPAAELFQPHRTTGSSLAMLPSTSLSARPN